MCCSTSSAVSFSDTVVYAAEVRRPDGESVHVLGYQNSLSSISGGPGAMIIPVPALGDVGPSNVVDSRKFPRVLRDYQIHVHSMKPHMGRWRRGSEMKGGQTMRSDSRQVFDSGSYTVVLSSSPEGLAAGIAEVEARKRPDVPSRFLDALGRMYPDWPVAICCFDGSEFSQDNSDLTGSIYEGVEPFFLWFRPRPDIVGSLFAPAVDAHDGEPPRPGHVPRNHTLVFGSHRAEGFRDGAGIAGRLHGVPDEHRWMFTSGICGSMVVERTTKNGDFTMPISRVLDEGQPSYVGADEVHVRQPEWW